MRRFICPWREKGEIIITRKSNIITAVLDYGDETCDDKASVTINGITKSINL